MVFSYDMMSQDPLSSYRMHAAIPLASLQVSLLCVEFNGKAKNGIIF